MAAAFLAFGRGFGFSVWLLFEGLRSPGVLSAGMSRDGCVLRRPCFLEQLFLGWSGPFGTARGADASLPGRSVCAVAVLAAALSGGLTRSLSSLQVRKITTGYGP